MVVGNGMIAQSLSAFKNNSRVIIFASGVSNSKEIKRVEYDREKQLISKFKNTQSRFVYFSTCSIFDKGLKNSEYVLFKSQIEEFLKANFKQPLIIRLPTVIGISKNPNIFFNHFKNRLTKDLPVSVYRNSSRYMFDIEDLEFIVQELLRSTISEINICFNNKEFVPKLVNYMKTKLQSRSVINIENRGEDLSFANQQFLDFFKDKLNTNKSAFEILNKYL